MFNHITSKSTPITLLCWALMSWGTLIFPVQAQGPAKDPFAIIKQGGSAPVILRLSGQPIRTSDPARIRGRQTALRQLQERVLVDIHRGRTRPDAKYFSYLPMLGVTLDQQSYNNALTHPEVVAIYPDKPDSLNLSESTPLIDAPAVWDEGFSGTGQVVAVLDTGVDGAHAFLSGKVLDEICFSTTNTSDGATTLCPNGQEQQTGLGAGAPCVAELPGCDHGTHVAGIAAGLGSFSGVAQDADIMAIQVFSRFPSSHENCGSSDCPLAYRSDQLHALEYVYSQRDNFNIASVNMSLGGGQYNIPCDDDPRKAIIDLLRDVGIATVISSGNGYRVGAIGKPACISSAISVGSTTKDDEISSFSNHADFLDLLAPGQFIRSAVPGGDLSFKSGTSMAAPHVAGAFAVLRSANSEASVETLLNALRDTGLPISSYRNGSPLTTKPRIQLDAALDVITPRGRPKLEATPKVETLYLEANQTFAQFGYSVADAGDVNGDGFGDLVMGAATFDNGQTNEGAAFLYLGNAGELLNLQADFEINRDFAQFGYSVSGAGDVNGDGYADVIIGAPAPSFGNDSGREGRVYLYYGDPESGADPTPVVLQGSSQIGSWYGASVTGLGDINGDGFDDIATGAPLLDGSANDAGAVFIHLGSANGIDPAPTTRLVFDQAGAQFGLSVSGAGDINGDGYADMVVGAPLEDIGATDEGAVYLFPGSPTGVSFSTAFQLKYHQGGAQFGYSVSDAGDVNADGYADVVIGTPFVNGALVDEGALFVYYGGPQLSSAVLSPLQLSGQTISYFGASVSGLGDIDGDGFADVIAGAFHFDDEETPDGIETDDGMAFIFRGSASGLQADPSYQMNEALPHSRFGFSVSGAGDLNGDGYADIVVGASKIDRGQTDEGAMYVYLGGNSPMGFETSYQQVSTQTDAQMGFAVAHAGDINTDRISDLIVGAPNYDDGELDEGIAAVYVGSVVGFQNVQILQVNQEGANFGYSVAGAGDINGDGFSDVLVGARTYDGGEIDEGAVFLYQGVGPGLDTTPALRLESNQANALMGYAVAGVGDVNGDGINDVAMSALAYSNGQNQEGVVFIHHGSFTGLDLTPATLLEVDQATAQFGISVAGAGDVNGDGYADVLVGARQFDAGQNDEGAAFVFLGGPSGVSTTPITRMESNQENALFGTRLAGLGDIDNDGYDDVAVGARWYDTAAGNNAGAVFIYMGNASGIGATPALRLDGTQALAQFGYTLGDGGDVNGDGYADLIVGAPFLDSDQPNTGAAYIYQGGASGLSATPLAVIEGDRPEERFGWGVSTTGDFNGDGFGDVVVSNPDLDGGALYVYNGNTRGRRWRMQARRASFATPVAAWTLSRQVRGFSLSATLSSPRGRENAKLQTEACPPGIPFGDPACSRFEAPEWQELTAASMASPLTTGGLEADVLYRWRVRTLYAPATVDQPGIVPPPNPRAGPWRLLGARPHTSRIRVGMPQGLGIAPVAANRKEGDSDSTSFDFLLTRTGVVSNAASVAWAVSGSGENPADAADFGGIFPSGTLNLAANQDSITLPVSVTGDRLLEENEDFIVTLSNPQGVNLGNASAAGSIRNDDPPGFTVSPTRGLVVDETGSTDSFTVVLDVQPPGEVLFDINSNDPDEFSVSPDTLRFSGADWNQPQVVTVTGEEDGLRDGNQSGTASVSVAAGSIPRFLPLGTKSVQITTVDNGIIMLVNSVIPDPVAINTPSTISVTVNAPGGIPTGTVNVSGDGQSCLITLVEGSGSCQLSYPTAGEKPLTARYSGDAIYGPGSATATLNVGFIPDLALSMDGPDGPVNSYPLVVSPFYTLIVENRGAVDANDVLLDAPLAEHLDQVLVSACLVGGGGTCDTSPTLGNHVQAVLDIPGGESATLTLNANLAGSVAGNELLSVAAITPPRDYDDQVADNNTASHALFTVGCPVQLEVKPSWTLLGLPCSDTPADTISDVFVPDLPATGFGTAWRVAGHNPPGRNLQDYPGVTTSLNPGDGRGHGIKSVQRTVVQIQGPHENTPAVTPQLVGSSGGQFNLLGHTLTQPVCWDQVRIRDIATGGQVYDKSLLEAEDDGVISTNAFRWNGAAYVNIDPRTIGALEELHSLDAFWLRVFDYSNITDPVGLYIPRPTTPTGGLCTRTRNTLAPGEWYQRLIVSAGELVDDGNLLGQQQTGVDTYDRQDLPALAALDVSFLDLVIPHPEWGTQAGDYNSDYRALNDLEQVWELEILSDQPRIVTLRWEDPQGRIEDIILRDVETGMEFQPRAGGEYTVSMNATTHRLQWILAAPATGQPTLIFQDGFE